MSAVAGLLNAYAQELGLSKGASHSELPARLERLANEVETRWAELDPEDRGALAAFAYAAIEPPRNPWLRLHGFINRIRLAFRLIRGEEEEVGKMILASYQLVEAVLSAIEREDPTYLAELRETLRESRNAPATAFKELTATELERRAWLARQPRSC